MGFCIRRGLKRISHYDFSRRNTGVDYNDKAKVDISIHENVTINKFDVVTTRKTVSIDTTMPTHAGDSVGRCFYMTSFLRESIFLYEDSVGSLGVWE